jgi:hypothetical protein
MGYSAARRNGIGRLSFRFRAVLLDDAGGEVAVVSSPARAEQIAGLLNAASQGNLPPKVGSEASYPHYEATTLEGKRVVLRAEWLWKWSSRHEPRNWRKRSLGF